MRLGEVRESLLHDLEIGLEVWLHDGYVQNALQQGHSLKYLKELATSHKQSFHLTFFYFLKSF